MIGDYWIETDITKHYLLPAMHHWWVGDEKTEIEMWKIWVHWHLASGIFYVKG